MRFPVIAAVLVVFCFPWSSDSKSPLRADETLKAQEDSRRQEFLDLMKGRFKSGPQNLDAQLEKAKRELEELSLKSDELKLRIEELEETRLKVTEIKNLLAQLTDDGWIEINQWIQMQLRERSLVVEPDLPSRRFEREQVVPAEIQLRVLTDRFGKEHPAVKAAQKNLEELKQQLEALRSKSGFSF